MTEPESFGPEGGHMGVTIGGWRDDARRTEVDLEDTAALARRYEVALERITQVPWPTGDWGRHQREAWDAATEVVRIAKQALEPD
jgi:hypothetical protein